MDYAEFEKTIKNYYNECVFYYKELEIWIVKVKNKYLYTISYYSNSFEDFVRNLTTILGCSTDKTLIVEDLHNNIIVSSKDKYEAISVIHNAIQQQELFLLYLNVKFKLKKVKKNRYIISISKSTISELLDTPVINGNRLEEVWLYLK